LASTARLGAAMRRLLAVPRRTGGVDESALVRRLARLRPVTRLPPRLRRSWPHRLQVYWDQSEVLGPCLVDQGMVLDWLRRWRGEAGLECVVVRDSGEMKWHPLRRHGRTWTNPRDVRPPDGQTTVLALSDLGFANASPARRSQWTQTQRQALRSGARCAALVPCPRSRWSLPAARAWNALEWERPFGSASDGRSLDELFVLLSPAIRIEPGLLREVRRLVGGADVGVELDAWMDSRVYWRSAALGMVLDPAQAHALQVKFRALPDARRKAVLDLLHRFHEGLAKNILAEERLLAGDPGEDVLDTFASETRGWLDHKAQYEDLSEAEVAYLERLSWRLPAETWKRHPELGALWAVAHRTGDGFAKPLPGDLELADVIWALEDVPEPSWWLLVQRGTRLGLLSVREQTRPMGSVLAAICARLPQVDLRWSEAGGTQRRHELRASQSIEIGISGGSGRVEVVGDLGGAELVLTPHPPWADRFWRDSGGLWVETSVRGFDWKVVEGKRSFFGSAKPKLTIVSQDLKTRLLWPTWAKDLRKDAYGVVADLELAKNVVIHLRWIPPGRFLMGSSTDEKGRDDNEGQHWVTLSRGYWLADAPCTQAEWQAVMGAEPSYFKGEALSEDERGRLPVEQVSWDDCQQFCERLRARFPSLEARLPSEAEWEYACRAGTAGAFNDGSTCTEPRGEDPALARLGWFDRNGGGRTQPVRKSKANPWGLHDMHGNVCEWCQDWLGDYAADEQEDPVGAESGHQRVLRGGSWDGWARDCRSACRNWWQPGVRNRFLGFRLVSGQPRQDSRPSEERAAGKQAGRSPAAPGGERSAKKTKARK
jgi:formylglycine-generating enzyme required for sulfatase activity